MTPSYGDDQVKAWRAFGLKPLIASVLLLPGVNALARGVGRYVLPHRMVERLPLRAKFVRLRLVSGNEVKLFHPERDLFAKDVYWGGGRPTSPADDRVLRAVETFCAAGGTFLDIGSYSAAFAMIAAKANSSLKSVAYEIVPENFLLMVENVIANGLNAQVDLKLVGLGAADGSITVPSRFSLASNPTSISLSSQFAKGNRVPVTTLDEEGRDWPVPITMKIDVEGFELEIFEGGRQLLGRHRPDMVCEILGTQTPDRVRRIEAILKEFGYRFYQSEEDGFVERSEIKPTTASKDWLFSVKPDVLKLLDAD